MLLSDGFHFLTIGSSAYEEAAEEYNSADQIVGAYEEGINELEILDEEGEVIAIVIDVDSYAVEAMAVGDAGEPDPADFGAWIPGILVLLEN